MWPQSSDEPTYLCTVPLVSILSSLPDPFSCLQYSRSMFDCHRSDVHWQIHCPIYNIPCQCSTAVYPKFIDGSIVLSTIFHVNVRLQSILSTLTDPLSYLQYPMSMFDCSLSWAHWRIHCPIYNIPCQRSTAVYPKSIDGSIVLSTIFRVNVRLQSKFIDGSIVLSTIFHVNVRLQSKFIDGSIVLSTIFHVNVRLQSILSSLMDPLSYLQYSMSMFDCSLSSLMDPFFCLQYSRSMSELYPEFIDGSIRIFSSCYQFLQSTPEGFRVGIYKIREFVEHTLLIFFSWGIQVS